MRYQNVVRSFRSGVWSPRVTLRSDSDRFDSACQTCKNFVITPQGGATLRHGSEYIGDPKSTGRFTRILPFRAGGNESDVIVEITDGATRFWRDDALIDTGATGSPDEVTNPYLQADLEDVQFVNKDSLAVSVHEDHPPVYLEWVATDELSSDFLPITSIPEASFNDFQSPVSPASSAVYDIDFDGTWVDGDRFIFSYDGVINTELDGEGFPDNKQYTYTSNTTDMEAVLKEAFEDSIFLLAGSTTVAHQVGDDYEATVTGPDRGRVAVITHVGFTKFCTITISSGANDGKEPAWSYPYVVQNGANYYQCTATHASDATNEPGVGASWTDFWTDLGTSAPAWWDYQHGGSNTWASSRSYAPWGRGWPRCVTFHEQRLVFGGSPSAPTTVWGSRISDPQDFVLGPNASDPYSFTIDTRGSPAVKWLESNNGLLIGTSAGEFLATADTTLSPGDINVQKQNNSRAHFTPPITVNYETFYIEQGQQKIRNTRYRREFLGFISEDISLAAEHLFYGKAKRIVLTQTPEVLVTVLLDTGQLLGLTYDTSMQTIAWFEYQTSGTIADVVSIYSEPRSEDELYLIVQRDSDYRLERMPYPARDFSSGQGTATYLDSYVLGTGAISGLSHLNGLTVGVTDDNAWIGEYVVSAGTISYTPTGDWAIGLRYTGELVNFEQSGSDRVEFGTARRWNKLYVRILDSGLPLVNGRRSEDRSPSTPMGTVEPLRTQDVKSTQLGFNDGVVDIEQDLPYPTHILGFFGQYGRNNA